MSALGTGSNQHLFLTDMGPHEQYGQVLSVAAWDYSREAPSQWGVEIEVKEHSGRHAKTISYVNLTVAQSRALIQFLQNALGEIETLEKDTERKGVLCFVCGGPESECDCAGEGGE